MSESHPRHGRFYKHFLLTIGRGIDPQIEPNLGSVYRYRGGLYKRRAHYIRGRLQRRRGLGFGSFFQSLFQRAAPLLRSLGHKTIDIVSGVARDALQGENPKESAIRHIQKAVPAAFSGLITRQEEPQQIPSPGGSSTKLSKPSKKKVSFKTKSIKRRGTGLNQLYPALKLMKYGAH